MSTDGQGTSGNPFDRSPQDHNPYGTQPGQGQSWPQQADDRSDAGRYESGSQQPAAGGYGSAAGQDSASSYGSAGSYGSANDPYAGYPSNPYEAQSGPYQQQPAPMPYGGAPYGGGYVAPYGALPPQHPQAVTAMVLGIIGMFFAPVGIGGFVLGARARRDIARQPHAYSGSGMATAGWVLGIISLVICVLYVLLIIFAIVVAVASTS